jgi:KDO2-lipid IV(A) lauroyltransferase
MKLSLARLLLHLLAWMPLGLIRALAMVLATIVMAVPVAGKRRRNITENLEQALPELTPQARRRLMRRNLAAMAATLLESALLWHRPRAWVERHILGVEGYEHVERARARGQGLLFIGGHLGQWELSILYGSMNLPIAYLYKPPRSDRADALLTERRGRFGAEMIPTGGAALRRALRQLRAGRVVGMLFDQLPRGGDFTESGFFGRPVATMTLPHRLVRATGCAVVMGHCLRVPGGWTVVFDAVPGAEDPDPVRAGEALNRALEQAVRRAPEQYLWQYRRFEALPVRSA